MRPIPDWFPLAVLGVLLLVAAGVAPPAEMLVGVAR